MDNKDIDVKATNTLLNQYIREKENVFIVWNKNLRDPNFYDDAKHLKQSISARFAANIKRGLNKSYEKEYVPSSKWKHTGANSQSNVKNVTFSSDNVRQKLEGDIKAELLRKISMALS